MDTQSKVTIWKPTLLLFAEAFTHTPLAALGLAKSTLSARPAGPHSKGARKTHESKPNALPPIAAEASLLDFYEPEMLRKHIQDQA